MHRLLKIEENFDINPPGRSCRKKWAFTRVPQYEFIGEANEELDNVRDLAECRSLCLDTTLYECRSATYYTNSRICKLSEETRRSAPSDFRPAERGIYYLENECTDSKRGHAMNLIMIATLYRAGRSIIC